MARRNAFGDSDMTMDEWLDKVDVSLKQLDRVLDAYCREAGMLRAATQAHKERLAFLEKRMDTLEEKVKNL